MKRSAFDKRNIIPNKTVIRVIIMKNGKRTTNTGIVTEILDESNSIVLLHNFKKNTYKIDDLVGITITGEVD